VNLSLISTALNRHKFVTVQEEEFVNTLVADYQKRQGLNGGKKTEVGKGAPSCEEETKNGSAEGYDNNRNTYHDKAKSSPTKLTASQVSAQSASKAASQPSSRNGVDAGVGVCADGSSAGVRSKSGNGSGSKESISSAPGNDDDDDDNHDDDDNRNDDDDYDDDDDDDDDSVKIKDENMAYVDESHKPAASRDTDSATMSGETGKYSSKGSQAEGTGVGKGESVSDTARDAQGSGDDDDNGTKEGVGAEEAQLKEFGRAMFKALLDKTIRNYILDSGPITYYNGEERKKARAEARASQGAGGAGEEPKDTTLGHENDDSYDDFLEAFESVKVS
jgi:hypothetical protein